MADEHLDGNVGPENGRGSTTEKLGVGRLQVFYRDAGKFLKDDAQIAYLEEVTDRLEDFGDLNQTRDLKITRYGDVWELEVKGFVLHGICVGICFGYVEERHEIAVVGVNQKDALGQPMKQYQLLKMTHRLLHYRSITTS
jgi:hypothetical protein